MGGNQDKSSWAIRFNNIVATLSQTQYYFVVVAKYRYQILKGLHYWEKISYRKGITRS